LILFFLILFNLRESSSGLHARNELAFLQQSLIPLAYRVFLFSKHPGDLLNYSGQPLAEQQVAYQQRYGFSAGCTFNASAASGT
jgi:hypothetical protein